MTAKKAKADPRVAPLYEQVSSLYKISFHRSDDETWACNVVDRIAHIYFQKTKSPGGALAHELLHVLIQHRGYRRLLSSASGIDQTVRFNRLRYCLDNELQHHKMYPEFLKHGFEPSEFYYDGDGETVGYLEGVLAAQPKELIDILPDFFTLIAPGGGLTTEQRADLEGRFLALDHGRFEEQLCTIRSAVYAWAQSDIYDAIPTLRTILQAVQNPSYTWFGHSTSDRTDGFFIDEPFDIDWQ